ncbi:Tropinesterase [Agromyces sp. NDB4Y10]|nr:Tropinesterase [Agromyces sp. NDB4Y10]
MPGDAARRAGTREGPRSSGPPETVHEAYRVNDRQYGMHRSGGAEVAATSILLVHGIGMTHASLATVQGRIPPSVRTWNVDLAGFGDTERPARATSVEEYAQDLAELLDRLDAWPVVAAGHSMGTQIVLELARLRPDGVRHVVMVGPVVDVERRSVRQQALDLARDTLGEPMPVNALVVRDYFRGGVRWYLKMLREMMRYPTLERMPGCTVPATVVRGERDPIAREAWCRRLVAENGAEARLVSVAGDRHVVPRTSPERLAAELVRLAGGPAADVGGS